MKKFLLVALLLVVFLGCVSSTERRIDMGKLDKIKSGVTTKKELAALLGRPSSMIKMCNGSIIWVYSYIPTYYQVDEFNGTLIVSRSNVESQSLIVTFSTHDVVKDILSRQGDTAFTRLTDNEGMPNKLGLNSKH